MASQGTRSRLEKSAISQAQGSEVQMPRQGPFVELSSAAPLQGRRSWIIYSSLMPLRALDDRVATASAARGRNSRHVPT